MEPLEYGAKTPKKLGFALWARVLSLSLGLTLTLSTLAHSPLALAKSSHQKVIDFEDEVVEGMNKRPLDSLSQISDADRRKKKPHLYRKRVGFKYETAETLRELRVED